MKKNIIIIFGLVSAYLFPQSEDYQVLSEKLCEKFSDADLNLGKSKLFQLVQEKSSEVNKENMEFISDLTKKLKTESNGKTDLLIAQEIATNISLNAIENCPLFTKISQKIAVLEHDSSKKSVQMISENTCASLKDYKNTSYSDLNKIVETIIYDLVFENEKQIKIDYGDNGLKSFYHDLNGELMANCELFFKITMDLQKQ